MSHGLEKTLGYTFKQKALLEAALTHASTQDKAGNNERLEFLGDRVLGLVVADMLVTHFRNEDEGSLAKRHAALVQQQTLVEVAEQMYLSEHIDVSAAEFKAGGQKKDAIVADALEAVIGALYQDGGYTAAAVMVKKYWQPLLDRQVNPPEDAKTKLQEWAQGRGLPLPQYQEVSRSGTDHAPEFTIAVNVKGYVTQEAAASNKRAAEKLAAEKMLQHIEGQHGKK